MVLGWYPFEDWSKVVLGWTPTGIVIDERLLFAENVLSLGEFIGQRSCCVCKNVVLECTAARMCFLPCIDCPCITGGKNTETNHVSCGKFADCPKNSFPDQYPFGSFVLPAKENIKFHVDPVCEKVMDAITAGKYCGCIQDWAGKKENPVTRTGYYKLEEVPVEPVDDRVW